jgi:hypothetical protein
VLAVVPALQQGQSIEDVTSGEVFFKGLTDSQGVAQGSLSIPSRMTVVDVVVDVAGTTGLYTVESYRTLWGPFSPSSRQTFATNELDSVTVDLVTQ